MKAIVLTRSLAVVSALAPLPAAMAGGNGHPCRSGDLRTTVEIQVDSMTWDLQGSPNNDVFLHDLFPGGRDDEFETLLIVTGLGWDLSVETIGSSWQSEATLRVSDVWGSGPEVLLSPAIGNDSPGTGRFVSGGIVDFSDAGIEDIGLDTRLVRLEWFESFDDVADQPDAVVTGSITLECIMCFRVYCSMADLAHPLYELDLNDVQAFLTYFTSQHELADMAKPYGVFDLMDIQAFATSFGMGCMPGD